MHPKMTRQRSLPILLGLLLASFLPPPIAPAGEGTQAHVVELGPDQVALRIPVGESLHYAATLRTAIADLNVGRVDLEAGVDPYRRSLLGRGSGGDTAWLRARAFGDYTLYVMDARMESRFQAQTWPALVHTYRHEGSEKRRRELLAGERAGDWVCAYRSDTKRGAPAGLRIWGPTQEQPVPRGAIDSLSAVYLVRSAIAEGVDELRFTMLDKLRIWDVRVTLDEVETIEVGAGTFRGRRVLLQTERIDQAGLEDPGDDERDDGEFAGPFGIKGNLELWLEEQTGIPLVIRGELPVLLGDLRVDLELQSFEGTPAGFGPLPDESR